MPSVAVVRRSGLAVVVAAAVTAGVSSCGGVSDGAGSQAPTAATSPTSRTSVVSSPASLAATLLDVNDRLAAQISYVITTTTSGGLTSTQVHNGDALSLDQTDDYGHFQAIRTGQDVWVRNDNATIWGLDLQDPNAPAAAAGVDPASLVGRWVLVTGTRLATEGLSTAKAAPVFDHPDDTTAGGHKTIRGTDTVTYTDPISLKTVYLSTDPGALPIEVQSTANSTTSVALYSKYGSAPAVRAPDPATVIGGTGLFPT